MANVQPYEIIVGPAKVYVAPTGTAFPDVDDAADSFSTLWQPLGQTDGGIHVQHTQTVVEHRTDQVTAARKATRTEEGLNITFSLAELTLARYKVALNNALGAVTTASGPTRTSIPLYRGGFQVETLALLVRGDHLSPYGDLNLQYQVPVVYENGTPTADFSKENKALLACSFNALGDENAADESELFGDLVVGGVAS